MVGTAMSYWIYILQSKKDQKYYVGLTSDVPKRLTYHNAGKVRSTKHRIPFELLCKEAYATRTEARKREKFLKSYAGVGEKQRILRNL